MGRQQPSKPTSEENFARRFQTALSLDQRGLWGDAERLYRALLAVYPNHFDSLHNLAVIRARLGDLDAAMQLVQRALTENPNSSKAHDTLGVLLRRMNRHEEAIGSHRKALALKSSSAPTRNNLGVAYYKLGRHKEAIAEFRRALAIQPAYADARNNLGLALLALGRSLEAITQFEKALVAKPDYAEAQVNLGGALRTLGRTDEALRSYERSIALNPRNAVAFANKGSILRVLGRTDEALHAFETSIKLSPRKGDFHRALADFKHFAADDRQLAVMEELVQDLARLSAEDQMHLHFALGKAYSDLAQHERSFEHLLKGNTLKRQENAYDEAVALGELDRIRAVFTAELLRTKAVGHGSAAPVFIVGMPRSGTTLVEQILASHPMVFGAGELEELNGVVEKIPEIFGGASAFPEIVPALTATQLAEIGAQYVDRVTAIAPTKSRITDKMPANFRYVGLIHLALPNARIIHTRRDPVDTCLSCFSKLFMGNLAYCYDLAELGRYYRAYERLMRHWVEVLPAGVMIDVQYEEITADLEREARRIVAHCGLDWDDRCLAFHKTERPVQTASATQVRQPIYRTSVGRWRAYEHLLGPLMEALGEPKSGSSR